MVMEKYTYYTYASEYVSSSDTSRSPSGAAESSSCSLHKASDRIIEHSIAKRQKHLDHHKAEQMKAKNHTQTKTATTPGGKDDKEKKAKTRDVLTMREPNKGLDVVTAREVPNQKRKRSRSKTRASPW